jgi:hypothetical protein
MIQPTSNYLGFNRADALNESAQKNVPAPTAAPVDGDRLSNANTQTLRDALQNSPEVRPEMVERGARLAVDANYPPRQIIESLAKLFTQSEDLSEKV